MSALEEALSIVLGAVYAAIGIPKLARIPYFKAAFAHLRMPEIALSAVGAAELLAAALLFAGLASAWLAVVGSAVIAVLMIGAVGVHLRAGDPPQAAGPAAALGIVAALLAILIA